MSFEIASEMFRDISALVYVTEKNIFWLRPSSSKNNSDRLSVHLSVTPFSQCFSHYIIMKFSEVITIDKIDVHVKDQG